MVIFCSMGFGRVYQFPQMGMYIYRNKNFLIDSPFCPFVGYNLNKGLIFYIGSMKSVEIVSDIIFMIQFDMNKLTLKFIKIAVYGTIIIVLGCLIYFDENITGTLRLKYRLKWGIPSQKEEVLNLFMEKHQRSLVPSVIKAILDDTRLPQHGDTGWGVVYHQAATAMDEFARQIDGKTQEQRGRREYSFYDDVGTAGFERRKEVYTNWMRWWSENKDAKINRTKREGQL